MDFLKKLYRLLFVWKIPAASDEEIRQADVLVVFAISWSADNTPGQGNRINISTAKEMAEKFCKPIIAEWYAAQADLEISYAFVGNPASSTNAVSTTEYGTHTFAPQVVKFCRNKGWKKAIVYAEPHHMGRVMWCLQKFGLKYTKAAQMPKEGYFGPGLIHWFSHRWAWLFRIRETIVRLLFWYWGYI